MQKNDVVRRSEILKSPEFPAVLFGAALAAACGGPAGVLHDVLDEAEYRVERMLDVMEDNTDETIAATAVELPPCPARYEPPVLNEGSRPYEDIVEMPAALENADEDLATHEVICEGANGVLRQIPRDQEQLKLQFEDFSAYADAMRRFIDSVMDDEAIETLSAEIDAIAEARPPDEDSLELRYQRLNAHMIELSPVVREMARGARRPGSRFNAGAVLDLSIQENLELGREPWGLVVEAHAEARAFLEAWNDYRRRIYEGSDAEDPDEAAAGWNPPTGVWTGLYVETGRFASGGPRRVRIAIEPDGGVVSRYLDSNCGGPLELISASGASGRIMEYNERGCTVPATVTLERTAEDRKRFQYGRQYAGNLARE